MSAARSVTHIDDDRVRVTTWTFVDGASTGFHVHEHDYVIVPITGGMFTVTEADGSTRQMTQQAGAPYLGHSGTAHDVTNASGTETAFVEIEVKHRD